MQRTRVRWGRLGAVAAAVAVAVGAAGGAASARGALEAQPAAARTYTVRPGDTVWELARDLAGPEADPRPVVDRILSANGLDGGTIQAGETIVLPAE